MSQENSTLSEQPLQIVVAKTPADAMAAMLGTSEQAPVRRRGRPAGSKNKPKFTSEAPATAGSETADDSDEDGASIVRTKTWLNAPKKRIGPKVARDEAGFLAELDVLIEGWRVGPERPILYDFEVAEILNDLKAKYGM
ncbi:MAG: hypothetical protein JWO15_3627 [Sphingomonadales bacterium]|nr:hypothetical protein [Sphingomonadales bacterium]